MLLAVVSTVITGVSRMAGDFFMRIVTLALYSIAQNPDGTVDPHRQNVLSQLPSTVSSALAKFQLDGQTTVFAVCPSCHYTYEPSYAPGSDVATYPERCTNRPRSKICPEGLCDTVLTEGGSPSTPLKTFIYHSFHDYLASLLARADIEELMDHACDDFMHSVRDGSGLMSDIFDGAFLREFYLDKEGKVLFLDRGDGTEGRYAFVYFVDFFPPEGRRGHTSTKSLGIIAMACLNLPASIRYLPENIYIAGIIPGPNQPHMEEINHYLRPAILDMRDSWIRGVRVSRTAKYETGRVTRSAIVVCVFDLPGGRKATGMPAPGSHWLCTKCNLYGKANLRRYDCEHWEDRNADDLRAAAEAWESAETYLARKKLFDTHGVRWSELWRLPYFDLPRQVVTEIMHALLAGLAEDESRLALGISTTLARMADVEPPAFTWTFVTPVAGSGLTPAEVKQINKIHSVLVTAIARPGSSEPVEPEGAEGVDILPRDLNWLQRRLRQFTIPALHAVASELNVTPTHPTRVLKEHYVSALLQWRQLRPFRTSENPGVQPQQVVTSDVMARIRKVIDELEAPSWLGSVPLDFGAPSAGTLKADQWRTLFTVHLPIALISLWGEGTSHPSVYAATHLRSTLDHFMKLVNCILLAFSRKMSSRRAEEYRRNIKEYISDLPNLHPQVSARTNHHVAFHVYDFLLLYGPAHSWWAFPYERLIGRLERMPSNHIIGKLLSSSVVLVSPNRV